jgi:hypothetical protein
MYKTFEGFTNFSIYEGITEQDIYYYDTLNRVVKADEETIISKNKQIKDKISGYTTFVNDLKSKESVYHYDDKLDSQTIVGYNAPKDIKSAINNDVNELKLYQNSIYITGIIACATLLISAILISKK